MHKKLNLPSKTCLQCSKPFTWRKKWERDWDNVQFCSKKCRGEHQRESRKSYKVLNS
ncbi:MAG: DUF2256 domain-containing protein [Gammaproteobacteria bacterium]